MPGLTIQPPQNPAQFLEAMNTLVMRPGFYPYPESITKDGIVFGPTERGLDGFKPIIPIDGSPARVLRNEDDGVYRAQLEGLEVIEDIFPQGDRKPLFKSGPYATSPAEDFGLMPLFKSEYKRSPFLGGIAELEGLLDVPARLLIDGTETAHPLPVSTFRGPIGEREDEYGEMTIRAIVQDIQGRHPSWRENLNELAVDVAFTVLRGHDDRITAERRFQAGVLFNAAFAPGSAERAVAMLASSAKHFSGANNDVAAAVVGELALERQLVFDSSKAVLSDIGKAVSQAWMLSALEYVNSRTINDICTFRGLRMALATGAWQELKHLYNNRTDRSDIRESAFNAGVDRLRAAWAAAHVNLETYPGGGDKSGGTWIYLDRVLKDWEGLEPEKRPADEIAAVQTLISAATELRLGKSRFSEGDPNSIE